MKINNPTFPQCKICKSGITVGSKIHLLEHKESGEPVQVCQLCLNKALESGTYIEIPTIDN